MCKVQSLASLESSIEDEELARFNSLGHVLTGSL